DLLSAGPELANSIDRRGPDRVPDPDDRAADGAPRLAAIRPRLDRAPAPAASGRGSAGVPRPLQALRPLRDARDRGLGGHRTRLGRRSRGQRAATSTIASTAAWPPENPKISTASSGIAATPDVSRFTPSQPSRIHTVPDGIRLVTRARASNSPRSL